MTLYLVDKVLNPRAEVSVCKVVNAWEEKEVKFIVTNSASGGGGVEYIVTNSASGGGDVAYIVQTLLVGEGV